MNSKYENIYKIARINAGMKREPAAEELNIATRTLDKYESGELKVPDDVVKKMCFLYQNSFLAYRHLQKSELGEFLPAISETNLSAATVTVMDGYNDFTDIYKNLIKMVSDGKITKDEKCDWKEAKEQAFDLAAALIAMAISGDIQNGRATE